MFREWNGKERKRRLLSSLLSRLLLFSSPLRFAGKEGGSFCRVYMMLSYQLTHTENIRSSSTSEISPHYFAHHAQTYQSIHLSIYLVGKSTHAFPDIQLYNGLQSFVSCPISPLPHPHIEHHTTSHSPSYTSNVEITLHDTTFIIPQRTGRPRLKIVYTKVGTYRLSRVNRLVSSPCSPSFLPSAIKDTQVDTRL